MFSGVKSTIHKEQQKKNKKEISLSLFFFCLYDMTDINQVLLFSWSQKKQEKASILLLLL